MKNLMKNLCWSLALVLLCLGCGKDKDQNKETAGVPQQRNSQCVQSGGYGCSWSSYPAGYSAYPVNNGYYAGYIPSQGYNNCNACPYGTTPIYDANWGLACVQIPQPQTYYRQPWSGCQQQQGQYGYLMNCNPAMPNSCPSGVCRPINQIQNPYHNWSQTQYSSIGVCQ
ncbi:MAG: hypothetical protein AB7F59_00565 [Bdellovibrionales bacterium]